MNKQDKIDVYILRIGDITEYTCVGDKYVSTHTVTYELDAMVWMWTNCGVPMSEFKKAITQLKKHRHTHARFGSEAKLFLYTDMEQI